jgi:molecular chaperone Hsp33
MNKVFDVAVPFLVNETSIRGKVVKLGPSLNEILNKHNYDERVARLLGELLVLVSQLGDNLKFEGVITVQLKSDGILNLMVADYVYGGQIRGYAEYNKEELAKINKTDFPDLVGKGYLAITIDQGDDMERYQGIVDLSGSSLSECIENYFHQSEQLPTAIKVVIGKIDKGQGDEWVGGGIMAQSLADIKSSDDEKNDAWQTAKAFIGTIRMDELLDPDIDTKELLYRLFHFEGVWVYDAKSIEHKCRCSRQRMEDVIQAMPEEEKEYLRVDGKIVANCQFCNREEVF